MMPALSEQNASNPPSQPASASAGWAMIWQKLDQLETKIQLTQLELAFYVSRDERSKSADEYVEEAVAAVYGLTKFDFYGARQLGRPPEQEAIVNQARFLLYTILHHILGVPVADLQRNYGNTAQNHIVRWKPIFKLVHADKANSNATKQAQYDHFAPLYKRAYAHMRQAMVQDGMWLPAYQDHLLDTP